ncbi:MAG: hypothetical protein CVV49_05290 [Spirochaetae bacterium HGW-Spirochaetae-5]|nr:MAG: hypothetical protein CVV49_05290 [Spirochaetae bacterium HGW-Spirochaetae-5]
MHFNIPIISIMICFSGKLKQCGFIAVSCIDKNKELLSCGNILREPSLDMPAVLIIPSVELFSYPWFVSSSMQAFIMIFRFKSAILKNAGFINHPEYIEVVATLLYFSCKNTFINEY